MKRDIWKYLHLSCPQSIYRWFKDQILQSVEHLRALSRLLSVHMEDFLVLQGQSKEDNIGEAIGDARARRLLSYLVFLKLTADDGRILLTI